MASSYTSLLKFNKPALGDAGWGTSVNGGFTDMVEQALTGALSVAVTSGGTTTVPTIADGVSSDARNQFITITGSLTSVQTATVQLPVGTSTNFKLYFVKNSAGGTVTVTTAAGTNVAVPNGASMILRVTNAGVETTMTHATSLTLSTALAVASGGTGTTTSTGSGSAVLSDSPVFTGSPTAPTASFGTSTTQLATTAFVQAALQALHPVGSIYINATNSTNPGTLLGFGTWVAFGAGRVPVGFDSGNPLFDAAEETGGSADAIVVSHTHTITDPGHSHTTTIPTSAIGNSRQALYSTDNAGTTATITSSTATTGISVNTAGSSGTNANYQPYITVYMWKRTA